VGVDRAYSRRQPRLITSPLHNLWRHLGPKQVCRCSPDGSPHDEDRGR
jgi:hypothetical protein